jgi:hypothetical protein
VLLAAIGSLVLLLMRADFAPKATVSGRITYQGKSLSSGIVLFYPQSGPVASGVITDGYYKIDRLALGPAKIMVWPAPPPP